MAEEFIKRRPPNAPEAERNVIGSMLLDREAIETAADMLTGDDFYNRQLGVYFHTILELNGKGLEVDPVTLQEALQTKNLPPEYIKSEYIAELISGVYSSLRVKSYAAMVQEASIRRKLIHASEMLEQDCYAGAKELDVLLDDAEKNIFGITQRMNRGEFTPIREIVVKGLSRISEAGKRSDPVTGLSTGFHKLNNDTSGFQPSDLILLAARPSMGKTALALTIAAHMAFKDDRAVVFFSLEMPKEQMMNRLFSIVSHVDLQKIRTGALSDTDWGQLVESANIIGASKMIIDDTSGLTVAQMRSKCRKYKAEHGLDIVFVDYLQLMSGRGRGSDSRQQEISDISRGLKALARELDVPVVALSQLSRKVEERQDHKPMLSDLRESGAIEQDADVVMFIYREAYYNKNQQDATNITELSIAKQRNGPLGIQRLRFLANNARFVSAEE